MQRITSFLLFIFAGITVLAQSITRLDDSRIATKDLDAKIDQLMKVASVTGMAVSIFNDGKPVYNKVVGYKNTETKAPLQANTNFYGASLSKAVFAVLVMKLVEEKIISLDKPLQDYLPFARITVLRTRFKMNMQLLIRFIPSPVGKAGRMTETMACSYLFVQWLVF